MRKTTFCACFVRVKAGNYSMDPKSMDKMTIEDFITIEMN